MKVPTVLAALSISMLVLAGCASGRLSESEQLAMYRAHAGAPVDSVRYLGRLDAWTPLGDAALAIWTRPNEAYLIEIAGPCPELEFATLIGLTHQAGRIHSRFDRVIPRHLSGGADPMPCHIREIRPLDVKALKAAQRQRRDSGG